MTSEQDGLMVLVGFIVFDGIGCYWMVSDKWIGLGWISLSASRYYNRAPPMVLIKIYCWLSTSSLLHVLNNLLRLKCSRHR